ncbi:MAG TPA: triose-phosphate isomerase [Desulfomonilaceae bacterium]|nr:triose-phosphate isomerase [Desulfomonilaceae bacterium]
MEGRTPIIAGNWKMHKTRAETRNLIRELAAGLRINAPECEVIAAPPFISISDAVEETKNTKIRVSAQNMHWEDRGAFTGEISGPMLREAGCSHVIIGHSERRQYFGETDEMVNLKIKAAIKHELIPIFCLGETLAQREDGKTFVVIKDQLIRGIEGINSWDPTRLVIAYEPVWAIGTGRTATPDQAQEVHGFLRRELGSLAGIDFAAKVRILYGGSVKPDNTRSLMNRDDIDGCLVGGASLKSEDFLGIIKGAA